MGDGMNKAKGNALILCLSLLCIAGVTYLARFVSGIGSRFLGIAALVGINLLNGVIALVSMRLMKTEIHIDLKNKKQLFVGAVIALSLSLVIAVIPALCGYSLIGGHMEPSWFNLVYSLIFYLLIIGPVEELVFRVYLQDYFISLFVKHKWLGVVIAAFLFGLWHIINGSLVQVLFTFGIGLVFGFARYKIKDCGYVGVALGHGLYDFLNVIVRMLIVK